MTELRRRIPVINQIGETRLFPNGQVIDARYPYLPPEEVIGRANQLFDTSSAGMFDWDSPDVISQVRAQLDTEQSPANKLFATIQIREHEPESQAAIRAITTQFRKSDTGKNPLVHADNQRHRVIRYFVGSSLATYFDFAESRSEATLEFMDEFAYQVDTMTQALLNPEPGDLFPFLQFSDTYIESIERQQLTKAQHRRRDDMINDGDVSFIVELADKMIHAVNQGWTTRRAQWTNQTALEAIAYIPTIRSNLQRRNITAAIENTLATFDPEATLELQDINVEGITTLLGFSWYNFDSETIQQAVNPKVGEQIHAEAIPVQYLPSTALEVLALGGKILPEEKYDQLLQDIHERAGTNPRLSHAWTTALFFLRRMQPEKASRFQDFMEAQTDIPEKIKEIFSDREPGNIWFKPPSRLIHAAAGKTYASAHLLYSSTAQPIAEKSHTPGKVHTSKRSEGEQIPTETIQIPLIGEATLVKKGVVNMLGNVDIADDAAIDADFAMLQTRFKQNPNPQYEALYVADLYDTERMRAAKALGVDAVYMHKDTDIQSVTFIMNEAYKKRIGSSTPIVIQGDIFQSGVMLVRDMTGPTQRSTVERVLNNLALELSMRTHYPLDPENPFDYDIAKETKQTVSDYNKQKTALFPPIDLPKDDQPIIPITLKKFGNVTIAMGPRIK